MYLPQPLALLIPVQLHLPADFQYLVQYMLGHLYRHAGIFQSYHGKVCRQVGDFQQSVDTGAQVEHGLQAGFTLEQLRRGLPYDGVVCINRRSVRIPDINVCFW